MTISGLTTYELSDAHFARIKELLYEICGIDLRAGKEGLVKARLTKRLRALSLGGFDDYLALLATDEGRVELGMLVDSMTTNKTSFFRESHHFDYIVERLLPDWVRRGSATLWSAACSSGEEPFTLAMVLAAHAARPQLDARILATDISSRVLAMARRGVYSEERLQDVPAPLRSRFFRRVMGTTGAPEFELDPALRGTVRFAQLNLMEQWPMRGPFDAILCRNAMIYFDKQTQGRLINRFYELLPPGGHLFIGHSESLTGIHHGFRYVQPAVYVR